MRVLLLAGLLLISQGSTARPKAHQWPVNPSTGKITIEKQPIEIRLTREQILARAKQFATEHSETFLQSYNVDSRPWALGRIKWGWREAGKFYEPGYISTTDEYVHARMYFAYEAGHSSIFRFTGFWADVYLLAKDNQTKVKITNIKYACYKISSPPKRILLHGGFPHSGPIEPWMPKTKYYDAFENAFTFLRTSSEKLIEEYYSYVRDEKPKGSKWD